jgi:hypothetical protein
VHSGDRVIALDKLCFSFIVVIVGEQFSQSVSQSRSATIHSFPFVYAPNTGVPDGLVDCLDPISPLLFSVRSQQQPVNVEKEEMNLEYFF